MNPEKLQRVVGLGELFFALLSVVGVVSCTSNSIGKSFEYSNLLYPAIPLGTLFLFNYLRARFKKNRYL